MRLVDATLDHIEDIIRREFARHGPPKTAVERSDHFTRQWLTNSEALEFLGLSRSTLQRYRGRGLLPFSKIGSKIFYRLEDLESLLRRNLRGGRSGGGNHG